MATPQTKTFESAKTSNEFTLRLSLTENSTDTANNTSNVTYTLALLSGGWNFSLYAIGYSITLGGTKIVNVPRSGATQRTLGKNSSLQLVTGTTTITHDSDGTKELSVAFSIDMEKASFTPGAISVSGKSMTLTPIARASSISVPTLTMGSAGTITISRAVSSFTHTLTYKFGSTSGTIATKTTATSVSFTPALTLATQVPSATSGTITITCETFSGSTSIGTKSVTVTLNVPASVKPTAAITVSDDTGNAAKYGNRYIQGVSKLKVTVTGTPAQGSAISSYETTANGQKYTGASFTTGVLNTAGNNTISATVTDKRGRAGTASATITVLAYSKPVISLFQVRRCNASGVADDQGEYMQVVVSGSVTQFASVSGSAQNTAKWTLKYRRTTDSTGAYTTVQLSTALSVSNLSKVVAVSSSYSWEVVIEVSDAFTEKPVSITSPLSTGGVVYDILASGKGMGFGKVAELENTADFDWDILARGNAKFNGDVVFEESDKVLSSLGGFSLKSSGELIPQGSNLNTYIIPGSYFSENASTSATIANSPTAVSGYRLFVIRTYAASVRGAHIALTSTGIRFRTWESSGGSWADWKTIV